MYENTIFTRRRYGNIRNTFDVYRYVCICMYGCMHVISENVCDAFAARGRATRSQYAK